MRQCGAARGNGLRAGLAALGLLLGMPVRAVRAEPVVPEVRIESARGVGLGTGSRASSASTQAQADNPANLVVGSVAHIESLYSYAPQLKRMAAGASVVDSMTSKLGAGLSARGLFGDNAAGDNSGWEGRLSLGLPIGSLLSIGVAGRYSNLTVSDPKARPERPPLEGETPDHTYKLKAFTMDAAATLRLLEGALSVSALAYNFINTDSPLAPVKVGGSIAFGREALSLGGDLLVDLNRAHVYDGAKIQVGGGLEYLTQGLVPLRLGYFYDQGRHQQAVTFGLGYLDRKFGVQISVRQMVAGSKDTLLFSSIQYFVQ